LRLPFPCQLRLTHPFSPTFSQILGPSAGSYLPLPKGVNAQDSPPLFFERRGPLLFFGFLLTFAKNSRWTNRVPPPGPYPKSDFPSIITAVATQHVFRSILFEKGDSTAMESPFLPHSNGNWCFSSSEDSPFCEVLFFSRGSYCFSSGRGFFPPPPPEGFPVGLADHHFPVEDRRLWAPLIISVLGHAFAVFSFFRTAPCHSVGQVRV